MVTRLALDRSPALSINDGAAPSLCDAVTVYMCQREKSLFLFEREKWRQSNLIEWLQSCWRKYIYKKGFVYIRTLFYRACIDGCMYFVCALYIPRNKKKRERTSAHFERRARSGVCTAKETAAGTCLCALRLEWRIGFCFIALAHSTNIKNIVEISLLPFFAFLLPQRHKEIMYGHRCCVIAPALKWLTALSSAFTWIQGRLWLLTYKRTHKVECV